VLGVVFCGGRSTRMGFDKGLIILNDKTWAQIAREKIESLSLPCLISINSEQAKTYQAIFKSDELVIDKQLPGMGGPLLGLLSVHHHFPNEDLLILACDLTEMKQEVLIELKNAVQKFPGKEAYVFKSSNGVEPLCGIYTSAGMRRIKTQWEEKDLLNCGLGHILSKLATCYLPVKKNWSAVFTNKNTPDALPKGE
jgi:molybdopterin-guanine dinucleotide biosynthesis protein A